MRATFSPVFSRVRDSEGIQPLYVSILQYKTWTVVTRWTWASMPIFTDFIWQALDLFLQRQQTALAGSISRLSRHNGRVGAGPVPAFKSSHRESFLCRGHSLWTMRQIRAPKAAAFAKLAYPITPELPSLERSRDGARPRPPAFCHPNLPAGRASSHRTGAHQPGIRGSKNDTKPPLPHLNMTYAKSSLAGAEDQGP